MRGAVDVEFGLRLLLVGCMTSAAIVASVGLAEFGSDGRFALLFASIRSIAFCTMMFLCVASGGRGLLSLRLRRRAALDIHSNGS